MEMRTNAGQSQNDPPDRNPGGAPADFGGHDTTRGSAGRGGPWLARWLRGYWTAQREGEERVRLLCSRVAAGAGHLGARSATSAPAARSGDSAPAVKRGRRYRWSHFASIARALRRRTARLRRDLAAHPEEPTTAVAISFKRLPCDANALRAELAALARALPGADAPERISAAIADAKRILVFEAAWLSAIAIEGERALADRVYVIDYATVVLLAIAHPFAVLRRLASAEGLRMCGAALLRKPSARGALPAVVFAGVYDAILERCGRTNAYLFTSFSFATELLRLALLHAQRGEVCEILHGVPSGEFDDYLGSVLDHAPEPVLHSFIAQVPALPLGGAIGRAAMSDPRFAVNAAVNRVFMSLPASGGIEAWIDRECAALAAHGNGGRELVITLIGAGALENDAFGSGVFAAEQALVRSVCDILRADGVPFVFLYAPHPMYEGDDFATLPLFQANRVAVCPQSVFTWLVSDACLAIYSSALFEAAYAGAQIFTPMTPGDVIYSAALLERVHAPVGGETCEDALRRFLRALSPDTRGLRERAVARAGRLNASARPGIG